ncbi:MAG: nucleoside-diphosphate kinase [Deltaproteobacteria bacterium]|nr:nucleoside-diphosphate kinase [Deltaproteobacteria bacterium]
MAVENTLSIIKPDGVKNNHIGSIVAKFEENGLLPVAMRMHFLTKHEAEGFYAVHKERPFFGELVEFMTSGPVLLMNLEGENAIAKNREIMGATNPADAADGTIRKMFSASIGENTVHGSDSAENAVIELNWFFTGCEIHSR